ncbi:DEAD/DEAH box helicase [Pseudonocardia spinosispora]|uniref:DEAD/DEAH box helicase n=1 Tax=Pseudonocardia spinosispora TaxID=103441 RepID=UPI003CCB9A9C
MSAAADAAEGLADAEPLQATAPVKPDAPTFAELGVRPEIVRALNEVGIERTFAIQELTLPLALAGEDVIGQARTGTGKTLGFGVPLLQRLNPSTGDRDVPQALVVVPTRELCVQVARDLADAGRHLGARITAIYGGRPYEPQVAELQRGVDIVVGTPGRLLDLAEQRHLVLGRIGALVLDEADEMLDLGFLPDVERILRMLPEQRQTMLFSATMPGPIITLSRTFLTQPTHIRAEESDASAIHERTRQLVYRAHALDKVELLAKALQASDRGLTMIFTRTKRTAQRVADDLEERGFAVAAVHGDLGQGAREQALRAFRSEKVDVLVATDVAARGIDVTGVTHVVNYQCPDDSKTYIHRIGRTGRAGREGVAVTLVDWDECPRWKLISDELSLGIDEPVETYSTSEHLFAELGIPTDATGRLPRSQRTREGLDAERIEDDGPRGRRGSRDRSRGRGAKRTSGRHDGDSAVDRSQRSESSANSDETPRKPRPPRQRRRRRAGVTIAGEDSAETTVSSGEGSEVVENVQGAENDVPELATAGRTRRPRRRRRGGGSSESAPDAAAS